jgi:YfiH family protein
MLKLKGYQDFSRTADWGRLRGVWKAVGIVGQWQHPMEGYWQWQAHENVRAIFTTRNSGVSLPPYDTMNLSLGVGDLSSAVRENRWRALAYLQSSPDQLIMAQQVHHNQVRWVGPQDASGGAYDLNTAVQGMDGLLIKERGPVLGMGFADCVPIFLTDQEGRVAGLLHAGWRGTVRGVQKAAVQALSQAGFPPETLQVGIGPSIGSCCYEVDEPVAEEFRSVMGEAAPLQPGRPGHYFLDLWEANRRILENQGVKADNIAISGLCTSCQHEQFFSYRRDHGRTGRMGGYICLKI